MSKSNLSKKDVRRTSALARRQADIVKHTASGDKVKAERAKADVGALKKKLGLNS